MWCLTSSSVLRPVYSDTTQLNSTRHREQQFDSVCHKQKHDWLGCTLFNGVSWVELCRYKHPFSHHELAVLPEIGLQTFPSTHISTPPSSQLCLHSFPLHYGISPAAFSCGQFITTWLHYICRHSCTVLYVVSNRRKNACFIGEEYVQGMISYTSKTNPAKPAGGGWLAWSMKSSWIAPVKQKNMSNRAVDSVEN